jgi:hypothetical protein
MRGESLNYHAKRESAFFGWSCIAVEHEIFELLARLKSSTALKDYNEEDIKIGFPAGMEIVELSNPDNSQYLLPGVPPASDTYRRKDYTIADWEEKIGRHIHVLIDERIADAIVGYKTDLSAVPKPIAPLGFMGRGKLFRKLSRKVVLAEELTGIDLDFRGIGELEKKQLRGYKGIVRGLPEEIGSVRIQFLDPDAKIIGETEVSSANGCADWTVDVEGKAVSSGIVRLLDKKGEIIAGERFYLLMEIGLDVVPISAQVKDLYGRNLPIIKNSLQIAPPGLIHWEPSYKERPEFLSDKLGLILAALGPKVLIHDPYGFGMLEVGDHGKLVMNKSGKCFFNGILVALTKGGIKEAAILIDPRRLKLSADAADELANRYHKLFEPLITLGLTKVEIGFAAAPFHDRYWLGMGSEGKLCHSSKSITGLLETDELDISFESGLGIPIKVSQLLARWSDSRKRRILG